MRASFIVCAFAAIAVLATGCSSKDKDKDKDKAEAPAVQPAAEKPAPPAEPPAKPALDEGDWNQYWPAFKQAALAKDGDAVRALTHAGGEIDKETLSDMFALYLNEDMLGVIAKTDAAGVKVTEGTEGADDEVRELSWSVTSEVDGEEMGSALFLYFKKIDGKYRLFRVLAAG